MNVIFRRTGERRYAVVVRIAGKPAQTMNPAPGFDEHIPHDLVHYVVEAELRLHAGVFGRAARGGGTFYAAEAGPTDARQQARERRKQARREQSLARERQGGEQMRASERLAYLSDIAWRRKQGQKPSAEFAYARVEPTLEEAARVERVVRRLDELAPRWRALPVGGELTFEWPSLCPATN